MIGSSDADVESKDFRGVAQGWFTKEPPKCPLTEPTYYRG